MKDVLYMIHKLLELSADKCLARNMDRLKEAYDRANAFLKKINNKR